VRVLSVASEIFPLVKTGGLADVVGALPKALAKHGVETLSLVPGYPAVLERLEIARKPAHGLGQMFSGSARLLSGTVAGLELLVLDAPDLFQRPGGLYADASGQDWPDNAQRFAALARAAAALALGEVAGVFTPDVVHAHDWQAGLAPAYLHYAGGAGPGTVLTVHNLAFQGLFPAGLLTSLGLPAHAYAIDGVEYFGSISYLKAGLQFADRITTVSPTYAAEIRTPEGGMGLAGLLQARAEVLSGILNGIDDDIWNPTSDAALAATYDATSVKRRAINKKALQQRFDLSADPNALLFGVVSRLSGQKGLDLLLDALPALVRHGGQLALLGSGDPNLERGFRSAAAQIPGRVGVVVGYDETLAHLLQGGADALLVPSRFEPCGLTQLCAMRYGAVPVVARVGGLNDSVIDANQVALAAGVATGFQFAPVTRQALEDGVRRTAEVWRDQATWRAIQRNGMAQDLGWNRAAARYAALYRELRLSRAR
jgi:starch synthase